MKNIFSKIEDIFIKALRIIVIAGFVSLILIKFLQVMFNDINSFVLGVIIIVVIIVVYKLNQHFLNKSVKYNLANNHSKSCISVTKEKDLEYAEVIESYGKLLEKNPPSPVLVYDVSKLPYPKDTIKRACLWGLENTDDISMVNALKFGYVSLANYQDNIDSDILSENIESFYDILNNYEDHSNDLFTESPTKMESYLKWLVFHEKRMPFVENEIANLQEQIKKY